jgi:hypothetical protein
VINQNLHRQPVALDRSVHLKTRLKLPVTDWTVAAGMNSMFLAAVEFGDACRDFPIVFVGAGEGPDGKPAIAPVAVFGLGQGENLYLDGTGWRAAYMPAMLRLYPFAMSRIDEQSFAIVLDTAWSGVSQTEGDPLFTESGEVSELTKTVQQQLEHTEAEVQRTRFVGERLRELDLLREMRFDAKLPDGSSLSVEGFLTVDEEKLKALPDATIVDLQRTGMLGLIHAHLISLGHMRRLAEWRMQKQASQNPKP